MECFTFLIVLVYAVLVGLGCAEGGEGGNGVREIGSCGSRGLSRSRWGGTLFVFCSVVWCSKEDEWL